MPNSSRRPIVVASPDRTSALARVLADAGTIEIETPEAFARRRRPAARIGIDIDLGSPSEIATVREGLRRCARDAAIGVAVDRANRTALIQARALGATETFTDTAELLAYVCTEPGRPGRGHATIAATWGAATLDDLFDGLRRGTGIDMQATEACGAAIVDTVAIDGIAGWLDTIRAHHSGTYLHCLTATGIAVAFGQALRLAPDDLARLAVGGLLHDVGKAKIPPELLDKPGTLDPGERSILRFHTIYGDAFAAAAGVPPAVRSMIRHHHEALDGSGYPDGLAGDQIDRPTRIMTIADITTALIEKRAYHEPLSPEAAYAELVRLAERGIVDAQLTAAFAPVIGEMRRHEAPPRSRLRRAQ